MCFKSGRRAADLGVAYMMKRRVYGKGVGFGVGYNFLKHSLANGVIDCGRRGQSRDEQWVKKVGQL